ncbi:MAG: ATP-binding protein [Candidatus Kapaibacterium sp.]
MKIPKNINFETIFNSMNSGFAVHELVFDEYGNPIDYVFLYVNNEYEKLTGLCYNKVVGKTVTQVLPTIEHYWIEQYSEVAINGSPIEFIDYVKSMNKYFHVKAFSHEKNKFAVIIVDITEKQTIQNELYESKRKLKESEAQYKASIESSGLCFILLDNNCNLLTYNNNTAELYKKYSSKEISISTDIKDFLNCFDIGTNKITNSLKGAESSIDVNKSYNNKSEYYNFVFKPVYEGGTIIGALIIVKDISEKKEIELKQKYDEEKLRTILEIIPDGIIITDEESKFLYLNKAAQLIFNIVFDNQADNHILSDYNIIRDKWKFVNLNYEAVPIDEYPSYISLQQNEVVINKEMGLVKDDGEILWLSVSSAPIPIPGYGAVLIVSNITQSVNSDETNRKLIQDLYDSKQYIEDNANQIVALNFELEDQAARLQELNKTKDKFFSIISHDLKNPLGGFMQITEVLVNDLFNMPISEIHEVLNNLHSSADNIYKLLNNLLDWSKSQTGNLYFNPHELSLNYLVNNTIELLQISASNKEITLQVDIENDIMVFADAAMISTVLRNMITNAIKYTRRGGMVSVRARVVSENKAYITISDNGIGMPDSILNDLFSISTQKGRSGTENEPSTGLGLVLCKEFVSKNGGEIIVESDEGVGSKFSFTLPLYSEELHNNDK